MSDALRVIVSQSIRRLKQTPALTSMVVVTLALTAAGGMTSASVIEAIWLRSVSSPNATHLVSISVHSAQRGQGGYMYDSDVEALRRAGGSLEAVSLYSGSGIMRLESDGASMDVGVEGVEADYFGIVGVSAQRGRVLVASDIPAAADAPVAVITEELADRLHFGVDEALGQFVVLDGVEVSIVGVLRSGFTGLQLDGGADVMMPITFVRAHQGDAARTGPIRAPAVVGRLRDGVSVRAAEAEVIARWPIVQESTIGLLSRAERESRELQTPRVDSLRFGFSGIRNQWGQSVRLLFGLFGALICVGVTNVVGLMWVRCLGRIGEVRTRSALGASRARLVTPFLSDGLVLALVAFAVAMPLAWLATSQLEAMLAVARPIPMRLSLRPNAPAVLVALISAVGIGAVIGLVPVWALSRPQSWCTQGGTRGVTKNFGYLEQSVLAAQIGFSMMFVVISSLFGGSLSALAANGEGISASPVSWARLARTPGDRSPFSASYFEGLARDLSSIDGVTSASFSVLFPSGLGFRGALPTDAYRRLSEAGRAAALTEFVSPKFFDTVGIPILQGRDFTWADGTLSHQVVVISRSMAMTLFPEGSPVGHHLSLEAEAGRPTFEVIGVSADAPIGTVRELHPLVVFRPMAQNLDRAGTPIALLRAGGTPSGIHSHLSERVVENRRHFVRGVFTLKGWMDFALLQERLLSLISAWAGLVASILAAVGLFGALSHLVSSRSRELGLRLAIGATRRDVFRTVAGWGLRVVVAGGAFGVLLSLVTGWSLRSLLYGVTPVSVEAVAMALIGLLVVGLFGVCPPCYSASCVDPVVTLRDQ